jgi:predicted ribosome quality control (RQC) complex YloA/Tae2 family protein
MKTVYLPLSNHQIPFRIGQKASDHFPMLDQANPSDLWFHLDNHPSCHIIASVPEYISRDNLKKLIRYGIRLSKEHSKHGSKVDVIYTRVRNVIKGDIEGQVRIDI